VTLFLVDTSFLVAFLQERDEFHPWAVATLKSCEGRLLTCEAVLAETCHMLRERLDARRSLLAAVAAGSLEIPFVLAEEAGNIQKLMHRYRNIPMSLADACLVRMAEVHAQSVVLTLDADFRIYRKADRQVIPTLMPFAFDLDAAWTASGVVLATD
jgi:predicted nucleic acid-binding protein